MASPRRLGMLNPVAPSASAFMSCRTSSTLGPSAALTPTNAVPVAGWAGKVPTSLRTQLIWSFPEVAGA